MPSPALPAEHTGKSITFLNAFQKPELLRSLS